MSVRCNTVPDGLLQFLNSNPNGIDAQVTGTVSKIRSKQSGKQLVISGCTVIGEEQYSARNLIIYSDENILNCHEGDIICVSGKISRFPALMNRGEFDSFGYYASMNTDAKVTAKDIRILKENTNRMLAAIFHIKDKMRESFDRTVSGKDAGVIISMVLGDKEELDSRISGLYQRSGIAHILAISGLHISIIGMTLYRLLRRAGLKFAESAVLSSAVILCYGIMTGNAVSTIRAFVMFTVSAGAQVFGRKYDMLSAASLSAILILSEMPFMLTNSGFLLSFGAVVGIDRIYPVFEGLLPKEDKTIGLLIWKRMLSAAAASLSISLTTLPVLLCSFYEFSLWSVLLNLIVIPLMGLAMAGGLIGGAAGIVSVYSGKFMIGVTHYILEFFEILCKSMDKIPFGRIITGIPDVSEIMLYYCMLAALAALPHLIKSKKRLLPLLVSIVAFMAGIMFFNPVRELEVHMLYVGQGDGIYVRLPDGTNILFDGGSTDKKENGKYTLSPCLKAGGAAVLDYIFISHTDEDHYNGVMYLLENKEESGIRIKKLVMPALIQDTEQQDNAYNRLVSAAEHNGIEVIKAEKGMTLTAMKGFFRLECLAPDKNFSFSGKNASSAVFKMSYGNFDMLFTGDVEKDGERRLIDSNTLSQCEVLKVSHHGSNNSTPEELLNLVKPSAALISCGIGNRYNHPGEALLKRLDDCGAAKYITAECGEIRIKSDGSNYRIMVE